MPETTEAPFKLPASVASPQDLTSLILEIRAYATWYSSEAVKKRVGVTRPVDQPELSPVASEVLRGYAASHQIDRTSLDALITMLDAYGKHAPIMTITLAAPATNTIKAELTGWARANLASNILISYRFNSTILGGMVVRYGSRIYDWSFRSQLLTNNAKIPEILSRV
jgi:hypothetical protein